MKIAVIGYSGSGKSTLSRRLGEVYGIPVLHLDTVQFCPDWRERDREEARAMVAAFMQQDAWVIDGNYRGFFQEERLGQADRILFLNVSRAACLIRAFRRYIRYRGTTREDMAAGCREKMDREFVWWILYKGRTGAIRRHYREIQARYSDKTVVLKNQRQIDRFLQTL